MRNLPRIIDSDARAAIRCAVTPPPYLNVTSLEEDQWLRLWFLGGPAHPKKGIMSSDERHGTAVSITRTPLGRRSRVADTGAMSRTQGERWGFWRELIREQEQSGLSVWEFCGRRQASEPGFYEWRKRLAKERPLKFALVEAESKAPAEAAAVEVKLATGERLRIGPGVEAAYCAKRDDASSSERARVRGDLAVRYAAELRRAARAGERGRAARCFRRASFCLRKSPP